MTLFVPRSARGRTAELLLPINPPQSSALEVKQNDRAEEEAVRREERPGQLAFSAGIKMTLVAEEPFILHHAHTPSSDDGFLLLLNSC